jgi:hypothetical protein
MSLVPLSTPCRSGRSRTLLALVVMATSAAVVVGFPTVAGATTWAPQATVPSAKTSAGPALAEVGTQLYVAYKAKSSDHVLYSSYNGSSWSSQGEVSGSWGMAETSAAPSLVADGDDLYAFWTAANSTLGSTLWYSVLNVTTSTWSPEAEVSGSWGAAAPLTDDGPSATNSDGVLYVAWTEVIVGRIWYSALDGTSWTDPFDTGFATLLAPAIVYNPYYDSVSPPSSSASAWFMVAYTTNTDQIDWGACLAAQDECDFLITVAQALTQLAPAIASCCGGVMFFAWKGQTEKRVWWTPEILGGFAQAKIPNAGTNAGPALAVSGTTLYVAWKGTTTDKVFYSSTKPPF